MLQLYHQLKSFLILMHQILLKQFLFLLAFMFLLISINDPYLMFNSYQLYSHLNFQFLNIIKFF